MHDFQILNLIRYLVIQWSKNDTAKFSKNFPVLVLWSVITEVYPEMAAILKESPNSLTKMAFIVNYLTHLKTCII
jgi:hypothetical protein